MKTGKIIKRAAVLLLALMLAAGTLSAAAAEAPAPMDVDLIMAKNAIAGFHIEDGNGHLMEPRRAEDMKGRGLPDEVGVEPDYRGVVGYVSLQTSWEVSRFFCHPRIKNPVTEYRRMAMCTTKQAGYLIAHGVSGCRLGDIDRLACRIGRQ